MTWEETLLALVEDHHEGRLDETGRVTLERLLRERPEARRLYWASINHAVMLRSAFADSSATLQTRSPRPTLVWRHTALAAAALLLVVATAMLATWSIRSQPVAVVAVVANLAMVGDPGVIERADGTRTPLREGLTVGAKDRLITGRDASVDLRWRDEGTVLTVAGDSQIVIADAKATTTLAVTPERLVLERGSLVAEVAHQAPGQHFALTTPHAHISVIGTRFAVRAAGERTEVDVEQGRVRVATLAGEKPVEVGAGERAMRIAGQAPVIVPTQSWTWSDRRPIGVMMLTGAIIGLPTNPRGWYSDAAIDVTTPAGVAAFQSRMETQTDLTIALLKEMDAQGVVFWDLEGREHLMGYVGDPRQLARFAPEMDAVIDRMMQRLRDAGFRVGVALRAQAAVWEDAGRTPNLRTVNDPAGLLLDKIAYARQRWGATLFPILGQSGTTMGMETICRRVVNSHPDILLMPTVGDADAYRWCGAWQDLQAPSTPTPTTARRTITTAFGVHKAFDRGQASARRDELVRDVAAGDILTFRAWWRDPANAEIKLIIADAKAGAP